MHLDVSAAGPLGSAASSPSARLDAWDVFADAVVAECRPHPPAPAVESVQGVLGERRAGLLVRLVALDDPLRPRAVPRSTVTRSSRHSRNTRRALRPVLPLSRYTTLQVHVYAYGRHLLKELVRGERQPCVRHRAEDGGHGSAKGGTEGSCNQMLDRRQLDHVKRQCEELALCSTEVAPGA